MKIFRIATFLNFGGIEKRLINVSSYSSNDVEHIFVALNHGGIAEEEIKKNKKKVYCLNLPYKIPSVNTIYKIYALIKREKPDVVHTSGAEANFHGIIAAWLANVPVRVSEEIGIPSQGRLSKKVFRLLHSLSHVVIGNATQVLDYLKLENDVKPQKLKLVYNPVLFPVLKEKENGDGKFILISVCRLEPIKNLDTILKSLPELIKLKPNLEYWILGEGTIEKELHLLTASLNITEHVKFLGFKSNVTDYLLQADAFILPSFSEGFSNALVEAMYAGIPSVATRVGGASEIIKDKENGFLIDPHNPEQISEVLKEVVTKPVGELKSIGLKGKSRIVESYSLEQHMSNLFKIYKEAL